LEASSFVSAPAEQFFCKLQQFQAIATRYDKTARNFLAAIHLAAATIWLN
jgi:transposase